MSQTHAAPRHDVFTFAELAAVTGGHWEDALPGETDRVTLVTDSSQDVRAGALFVAIRGETADGHKFVEDAVTCGAGAVCIERDLPAAATAALSRAGVPRLRVPDTLRAIQELARAHRLRFPQLMVVAITGSSGKTSTKEMIASVLEAEFPQAVLKTDGNTNNHFGVPRNLLRLGPQHRAAVLELGSNHPGEIAGLVRLVAPQIGVVSNVGPAHLEFFLSLAGVAREKGSIFGGLAADGIAIYPADAPHADILRDLAGPRRSISFGVGPAADVQVVYEGASPAGYRVRLTWPRTGVTVPVTWGIGGAHQALNAGAAAAVGTALAIAPERIAAALAHASLPAMRMEVRAIDGVQWLNDAYNSNPGSAQASLAWFAELTAKVPPASCFLVLGDMREQTDADKLELHVRLLQSAQAQFPGGIIVAVGEVMTAAAARCGVQACADAAAAKSWIRGRLTPGCWVLLKGSRGVRLETLLM